MMRVVFVVGKKKQYDCETTYLWPYTPRPNTLFHESMSQSITHQLSRPFLRM